MKVSVIVAQSNNRVIGNNNELPWSLPKDLQYFKKITLGKPIVMGRKTFESIGRPLPGRSNIVISSNADLKIAGVIVVASLEQAISKAKELCLADDVDELMVIGGAQIYQQVIALADVLYVTQVDAEIAGDAFFPEFDPVLYKRTVSEKHAKDASNQYDYSFLVYEKISQ